MEKTLRLTVPDWQAGAKEEYYFGAQLLSFLAPRSATHVERTVAVDAPTGTTLSDENGVTAQSAVVANVQRAKAVIAAEAPTRIVVLGGDCLVSQAPIDYLRGRYGARLGVLWLDAHPDVSTPAMYSHAHAMVLANLLGDGDPALAALVEHPLCAQDVLHVGLQPLTPAEGPQLARLGFAHATVQRDALLRADAIRAWLARGGYTKVYVHWDLDVVDPADFHSLYFNEPGVPMFAGAACGRFAFRDVADTIAAVDAMADIVGFAVAEYLPWDAIRLRNTLAGLKIFQ